MWGVVRETTAFLSFFLLSLAFGGGNELLEGENGPKILGVKILVGLKLICTYGVGVVVSYVGEKYHMGTLRVIPRG